MQNITILGATGSIGVSTLDVIARHSDRYAVYALTAHARVAELAAQSHRNARPGIEDNLWGRTMTVLDPFSNRLVFWQRG